MSQAIAEITHFRKWLGISGNAESIEEIPELPSHLQKYQAFPEMPSQLRKCLIFNEVSNSGKMQNFKISTLKN
jgi:hypothetical protein